MPRPKSNRVSAWRMSHFADDPLHPGILSRAKRENLADRVGGSSQVKRIESSPRTCHLTNTNTNVVAVLQAGEVSCEVTSLVNPLKISEKPYTASFSKENLMGTEDLVRVCVCVCACVCACALLTDRDKDRVTVYI
jgi:hypothetical protein